jgi:hypothetical protein
MRKLLTSIASLALATTAFGQASYPCPDALDMVGFDDGGSETIWKIGNPSGPSDWFNVDFDNLLASRTIIGVAPAFDESTLNLSPSWAKTGIYPDNLSIDSTGTTPDIANPIAEVVSGNVIFGNDCNFNPFTIPLLHLTTATNTHVAFQHTGGDSAMWMCSDTSSTPVGRSYFTSAGYASPAVSFGLNWMLRVGTVPLGAAANIFLINGGTAATVTHLQSVALSFYGSAPGQLCGLFTAPPLPIGSVLFVNTGLNGPLPHAWTICGPVQCNTPINIAITFNVFWLNTQLTKPNGKFAILKSNTSGMLVTSNPAGCGFCFGQKDDGALDNFAWKVNQPAGSNDWFNVQHGAPSGFSGVTSLTGVEIANWDFCGTGGTGSWAEVGIYVEHSTITFAPDVSAPLATVGGASAPYAPAAADWGYPSPFYDTADVAANTTTIYHAAAQWNTGDSCLFVASDTTATGPDPCGTLPNSTSFSSPDGYTATIGNLSTANWLMKIDWN